MKALPYQFIVLLLSVLAFNSLKAQEFFSGSISYDLTYEGEMAEMFSAMMPSSYSFNFYENMMSFEMQGGMAATFGNRFVTDNEKGVSYMLKDDEKVAYEMKHQEFEKKYAEGQENVKPHIKKLEEQIEIAGYVCQKYEVITTSEDGTKATQLMWVTPELKVTHVQKYNLGSSPTQLFQNEEIDGFPLKIIAEVASQGVRFKMIMTASEVTKKEFSKSDFSLPSGYEIKAVDLFKN